MGAIVSGIYELRSKYIFLTVGRRNSLNREIVFQYLQLDSMLAGKEVWLGLSQP